VRAGIKREEKRQEAGAMSFLDRIEDLYAKASRILEREEAAGESKASLLAIRELRGIVDLLGRATGELRDGSAGTTVVNVVSSPDWGMVRAAVFEVLTAFPEARAALASRLLELEAPYEGSSTTVERTG
jgi:hypothetical protein